MKKLRLRILCVLMSVILCLSFASCNKGGTDNTTTELKTTSEVFTGSGREWLDPTSLSGTQGNLTLHPGSSDQDNNHSNFRPACVKISDTVYFYEKHNSGGEKWTGKSVIAKIKDGQTKAEILYTTDSIINGIYFFDDNTLIFTEAKADSGKKDMYYLDDELKLLNLNTKAVSAFAYNNSELSIISRLFVLNGRVYFKEYEFDIGTIGFYYFDGTKRVLIKENVTDIYAFNKDVYYTVSGENSAEKTVYRCDKDGKSAIEIGKGADAAFALNDILFTASTHHITYTNVETKRTNTIKTSTTGYTFMAFDKNTLYCLSGAGLVGIKTDSSKSALITDKTIAGVSVFGGTVYYTTSSESTSLALYKAVPGSEPVLVVSGYTA